MSSRLRENSALFYVWLIVLLTPFGLLVRYLVPGVFESDFVFAVLITLLATGVVLGIWDYRRRGTGRWLRANPIAFFAILVILLLANVSAPVFLTASADVLFVEIVTGVLALSLFLALAVGERR